MEYPLPLPRKTLSALALGMLLSACIDPQRQAPDVASLDKDGLIPTQLEAPSEKQQKDACWAQDTQPAIIQTVTNQVLIQPATYDDDDTLLTRAVYGTETKQDILRTRAEAWFQTTCPEFIDQAYTATLQRALTVRGYYKGTITGEMNAETRAAIEHYQTQRGLESEMLSLAAAKQLGVAAYGRPKVDKAEEVEVEETEVAIATDVDE